MDLIEQVRAARRANTPLLAIETQDQPNCQSRIGEVLKEKAVLFAWDAVRGLRPINPAAVDWTVTFLGVKDSKPVEQEAAIKQLAANTGAPIAALDFAQNLPPRAAMLMTNLGKWTADPVVATAILNLRETFKRNKRTLIATSDGWSLSGDLSTSMVLLEESLPTPAEREAILAKLYAGAKRKGDDGEPVPAFPALSPEESREAVIASSGLSAFMVEETFSMSLVPEKGLDMKSVWERKKVAFDQIDGLTLENEGPTFEDIRGLSQILKRQRKHFEGKNAAAVIVRIDEIEKALAGIGTDTSGTATGALGYLLKAMEDFGWTGFLAVGPGGAGKSLVSKALGREFRRPVVEFDIKGTDDKFVGESGRKMRAALRAIRGLADGRPVLVVGTCNKLDILPPELKRRFKQGIWFFDLPNAEGRDAIWKLYERKHGVKGKRPAAGNWTGAEIRNCVEMAADEDMTLIEAAEFIVPVAEADPLALRKLRALAHERFLNADAPGVYLDPDSKRTGALEAGDREVDMTE